MLHHGLDDSNLLPVLLAEISLVWAYDIEKATYHLAHSVEMPWTMSTLHDSGDGRIFKLAVVGSGVHLLDGRGKDIVGTTLVQQATIGIEGAGIVLKVVLVVELGGVDKH